MIEKNNNLENFSYVSRFIDIDKELLHKLNITFLHKKDIYEFISSIFNIGCMSSNQLNLKYDQFVNSLKTKLYPNSLIMAGYYCPKLYWIIIFLLNDDNSLSSLYFKAKAFKELPGQYKDYINYKEILPKLYKQCNENCIYYYETFLNQLKNYNEILPNYIFTKNILGDLGKCYFNKKDLYTSLKYYEEQYKLHKHEDTLKHINDIKELFRLKEQVYNLMKCNMRQIDIIQKLNISRSKIREIIELLKIENKVIKENNKYIAI